MANFDKKRYYWYNFRLRKVEYCTRRELVKKYKLDGSSLSKVVRNGDTHHDGWVVTSAQFANLIQPREYNLSDQQIEDIKKGFERADEEIGKFHRRNGTYSTTTIKELREKDHTAQ